MSPRVTSPFAPTSAQYYEFHQARIGDGSASPESWQELELRLSYRLGDATTLSASGRYWNGENNSLDLTDWERTTYANTVSLFAAPSEKVSWYVALSRHDAETQLPATIPIFDG